MTIGLKLKRLEIQTLKCQNSLQLYHMYDDCHTIVALSIPISSDNVFEQTKDV